MSTFFGTDRPTVELRVNNDYEKQLCSQLGDIVCSTSNVHVLCQHWWNDHLRHRSNHTFNKTTTNTQVKVQEVNRFPTRSKKTLKVDSIICLRFCSNSLLLFSGRVTFLSSLQKSPPVSVSTAEDIWGEKNKPPNLTETLSVIQSNTESPAVVYTRRRTPGGVLNQKPVIFLIARCWQRKIVCTSE